MIEIRNLTKRFGDLMAVQDLSLSVRQGEFFVVLGPNAAGKTTTIKSIVGLIRPTSGSLQVAGFDVQKEPLEVRRRLAYVPDFPFLYEKLTPWEFFRFTAQMFRLPDEQIEPRAQRLVQRFGLEPFLNKTIDGLSHGTRQRTAIVAALLHDPEVFVIDEPMVGLDPANARVVKDILKERSREGMTVFLSTHQLAVAEELADRIGIIHRGQLVAVGSPAELRQQAGREGPLENAFLQLTTGLEAPVRDNGINPGTGAR
jgi:ABC-2 type transport system ATP-binding protein